MPDGVCQGCWRQLTGRQKKWCADPDCRKRALRTAWIWKVYGLSLEDYQSILAYQAFVCGVCAKPFKIGKTPHIDHEHGGHVRGIVCAYCNTRLIGRLKSHELAQRLSDYLREPPAVAALGRHVIAPGRPKTKRRKRRGS